LGADWANAGLGLRKQSSGLVGSPMKPFFGLHGWSLAENNDHWKMSHKSTQDGTCVKLGASKTPWSGSTHGIYVQLEWPP